MNLIRITDLVKHLDISSRSLRYYEQIGLIQSARPAAEKYRYYASETVERLRQILVLRKMHIPIKDILRIYDSLDMREVVEAFVRRIDAIDEEITALSELKRIVNEFLQTMLQNGVTKISALPLLYEEMEKQLEIVGTRPATAYERLSAASERVKKPDGVRIVSLPAMRVLTSVDRWSGVSDVEAFWDWLNGRGVPLGMPGQRALFEYQDEASQTVLMQRVDDGFANDGPFADSVFAGGLFACRGAYLDDDLSAVLRGMIHYFDGNDAYEVEYRHSGRLPFLPRRRTVRRQHGKQFGE